jgi:hypothetical protein
MIDDQICVNIPEKPYLPPTATIIAPSIPTTPAPIPTDATERTNQRRGHYYKAMTGDYCNQLMMKFEISLADFRFLNPAI